MVLFTLLHKMRRKRTRSSFAPSSSPSTVSTRSSPASNSSSSPSSPSGSSSTPSSPSDPSSSSEDEKPLRSSRSATRKEKEEKQQQQRSSSSSKPPRKKLKIVNLNGASASTSTAIASGGAKLRRQKSIEISVVEKVKRRHQEAAAAKLKRQLEEEALRQQQLAAKQSENTNPAAKQSKSTTNGNNKAVAKDNGRKSAASSATTKSSATIARQNSIASSEAQSKSRPRGHGANKSEAGRRGKTDPEVIFRLFDKPSRIYQCLASRQHDRPIILKRNLAYMIPKMKARKHVPKELRFKLPTKLVANEAVLGDQTNNLLMSPTSKSKRGANTRLSINGNTINNSKLVDPKSNNLNLVLCRVVGATPEKPTTRSATTGSKKKSVGGIKAESFLMDVVVNRTYVGKNLETKSQVDAIHARLRVDFTRTGTDGLNNSLGDDDFFTPDNSSLLENSFNSPKTVSVDGNLLYPPNGYTQGRATVLIRAITEGAGWIYDIEMEVSRDRERKLENGYYSAYFRPINGAEEVLGRNSPRLLFAVCWSPAHVVLTREEVFENLRREIVRIPKTPTKSSCSSSSSSDPPQKPPPRIQTVALTSPTSSSPSRSPSRSRILRVVFWLSDPSAGGPGICASVANPFRCPWCHTICPHFLSLLRHLRCWHPRFNFVLQAERVARVADILVTLNRRYNCAEEHRHPPTLLADVPLVGVQKPVKRFSNTQIVWISGKGKHRRNFHKASSTALAEFRRPESDLHQSSMIMVAGHLRTYYHSQTCLPMTLENFNGDQDSDDEEHPWLTEQTWRLLNEFTDVNAGEKSMMNMWNRFMYTEKFFAQRSIFPACLAFVDEYGLEVVANGLLGNFRLHLTCLSQNNLLTAPQFYAVMARLQRKLDELKPPPPAPASAMTAGPSASNTSIASPVKDRPLRKSLSSTS